MTATFEYGDRIITLKFSLAAWEKMEQDVCTLGEFFDIFDSRSAVLLNYDTAEKVMRIACILAWAAGGQPPVTQDELRAVLTPADVLELRNIIIKLVGESLTSENRTKSGPRDLVLEELEGKN